MKVINSLLHLLFVVITHGKAWNFFSSTLWPPSVFHSACITNLELVLVINICLISTSVRHYKCAVHAVL